MADVGEWFGHSNPRNLKACNTYIHRNTIFSKKFQFIQKVPIIFQKSQIFSKKLNFFRKIPIFSEKIPIFAKKFQFFNLNFFLRRLEKNIFNRYNMLDCNYFTANTWYNWNSIWKTRIFLKRLEFFEKIGIFWKDWNFFWKDWNFFWKKLEIFWKKD